MRTERNRRQRKARWIKVKNGFRDPVCSDGVFWTNHVEEPGRPWVWLDFRFLSVRHPRRYFAVAARTLEYKVLDDIEGEAWDIAEQRYPYLESVWVGTKEWRDGTTFDIFFAEPEESQRQQRYRIFKETYPTLLNVRVERPKIEVRRDYGDVAIGLWVTLNTPQISRQVVHEFIQQFRDLGEPITHGVVWTGDEVTIDAREVNERYRRIYSAQP